jgi:uncharacterized Zn finger protein
MSTPEYDDDDELVDVQDACPKCGERRMNNLPWSEDGETVTCSKCGTIYTPPEVTDDEPTS